MKDLRRSTGAAAFLVILGLGAAASASLLSFGKKDSATAAQTVPDSSETKTIQKEKLRITAHFTNIFSAIEPSPVIRRSVKAGEEFRLVDSSYGYWIIRDGNSAGYISRNAAAIIGTAADTVLTPVIDTLSASDIPAAAVKESTPKADSPQTAVKSDTVKRAETPQSTKPAEPFPWLMILVLLISVAAAGISYWTAVRRKNLRRIKFRSSLLVTGSFSTFPIEYGIHQFSLKKFLLRFGIALDRTRSLTTLPGLMAETEPDFIFVDWRIAPDIVDLFRQLLGQYRLAGSTSVIFCHVDLAGISQFKSEFGTTPIYVFSTVPSGHQLAQILRGEGKPFHVKTHEEPENSAYLAGLIRESSLEEVIQMIGTGQKSGLLQVSDASLFGEIFFQDGIIVHASAVTGETGKDALWKIFDTELESFSFILDRQSDTLSLALETEVFLMEQSVRKDRSASE